MGYQGLPPQPHPRTPLHQSWRQVRVLKTLALALALALALVAAPMNMNMPVAAATETLVGIQGRDYVVLGTDGGFSRSLVLLKSRQQKVHPVGCGADKCVAVCGDAADCFHLVEDLDREVKLLEMTIGPSSGFGSAYSASTRSVAHMTRQQLLQKRARISALVAGVDRRGDKTEPHLLWLDQYGALQEMRTCAHGPSAALILSTLDERAHEDLSQDEAVALIQLCFEQLRGRFLVNTPHHQIYVLDADGLREIKAATEASP